MANEKRLIDANALLQEIVFVKNCLAGDDKAGEWAKGYRSGLVATMEQIEEQPTVDAVEVVHGEWRKVYTCHGEQAWGYECNQCKADNPRATYYCPNCGAKMDGDGNA